MTLIAIAAVDEEFGIGKDGGIPWHCPEDLAFFKEQTIGNTVLMGWKTAKPLEGRLSGRNLLVASMAGDHAEYWALSWGCNHRHLYSPHISSIERLADWLKYNLDRVGGTVYVAGGQSVYDAFLPVCDELWLTTIAGKYSCDRFFPRLDRGWTKVGEVKTSNPEIISIEQWVRYDVPEKLE